MAEQQKNMVIANSTPENEELSIDLVELFFKLLDRWKVIVCAAVLCALGAGLYTNYMITPLYRATSTIFVIGNRDSAINIGDLSLGSALTPDYIKLFKIWEIQEQVITNLDLPYGYGTLRGMVSVNNESDTRTLDITVTSPNPEEAANIANEYAEVVSQYIADTMLQEKPSLMSTALVPSGPSSPNLTRNVMLGFMMGAAAAAGVIVLLALMDDKYKTAEDIRKYTGLVTLAIVPIENEGSSRRAK